MLLSVDAGQAHLAGNALLLVLPLGAAAAVALALGGYGAAQARRATGATPDWLEPLWAAVGWAEVAYIVCTGIGYVAWGAAILDSGFPADWAGSVAVVLGGASVAAVALVPARATIPEVPLVVPIVLGIALVLV